MPLRGVPEGLVALTIPRRVGDELRVPRDRRQRLKPTRVDLALADAAPPVRTEIPTTDWHWLLGTERRAWPTVTSRFGTDAWDTACDLARAGLATIRCHVAGSSLGDPVGLLLTEQCLAERDAQRSARAATVEELRARAAVAAGDVESLDPGLADALRRARGTDARLPVLVFAAEDLSASRVHDGPRAFSQAHFGETKQRDDAPAVLRAAGAAPQTLAALGLERSPYLGLGGAVRLGDIDLPRLRGPVLFRANDPALLEARADAAAHALVVIENLQAAENVCDNRTDIAVVYSAGQPSDATLEVMAALAATTGRVLVIPDADLGGVRIAERILSALPSAARVQLIDVGEQPHEPRRPFAAPTVTALEAGTSGLAARLAKAVLVRGYPVEQEAATRAAVARGSRISDVYLLGTAAEGAVPCRHRRARDDFSRCGGHDERIAAGTPGAIRLGVR